MPTSLLPDAPAAPRAAPDADPSRATDQDPAGMGIRFKYVDDDERVAQGCAGNAGEAMVPATGIEPVTFVCWTNCLTSWTTKAKAPA